jgi:hypothetical protein
MKLGFSPATFLVAFCVLYALVFFLDFPMFRYYPLHGDFNWGKAVLKGVGPAMAWYGMMANATLGALLLAIVVPDRVLEPGLRNFLWLFPLATMLVCAFLLRHFFA